MKKYLFIIFMLLWLSAQAQVMDRFELAGQTITVPVPEGYERVTEEMPALQKHLAQLGDSMNVVIAVYISKNDAILARSGIVPSLHRYYYLQQSNLLKDKVIGSKEFALIMKDIQEKYLELSDVMKDTSRREMDNINKNINGLYKSNVSIQLSNHVFLKPHDYYHNYISFSSKIKVNVHGAPINIHEISMTQSLANAAGVVLSLIVCAPSYDLEWTRTESRDWVNDLLLNNKPIPISSATDLALMNTKLSSFDWAVVATAFGFLALCAAIIGFVVALVRTGKKAKRSSGDR